MTIPFTFQRVCDYEKKEIRDAFVAQVKELTNDRDTQIKDLQHVCDNQINEKVRLVEGLQYLNASNTHKWEQRDSYLAQLRDFHELRLHDMTNHLEQQQAAYVLLLVATTTIVAMMATVFLFVFVTVVKEKGQLAAQNREYECDIKDKVESQKEQYEKIIEEKANRIQRLEREQEQDRETQKEVLGHPSTMPHMGPPYLNLPFVYAFSGMPPMASVSPNTPQIVKD